MSEPRREFLKKVSRGRGVMYRLTGWTSNDIGIGIGIRKRCEWEGNAFCCSVDEDVLRCRWAGWCAMEALCSVLHDSQARSNY